MERASPPPRSARCYEPALHHPQPQTAHLHDELVRARDELQAVRVVELLRDVVAKGVAGAAW